VSSALLSRFGTPDADDAVYGFIGLVGLAALFAAAVAGAVTGGRGSAGTGLAHALAAAVLAAVMLAVVSAGSAVTAACTVGPCDLGTVVLGVGLQFAMCLAGGLVVGAAGLALAAATGCVVHLLRRRPARWQDTNVLVRHRRYRRPPPTVTWSVLALVALAVVVPASAWSPSALSSAADGRLPPVDVAVGHAAGSVPPVAACRTIRANAVQLPTAPPAVAALATAAAADPALAAMGQVWRTGLREGRPGLTLSGSTAAIVYCEVARIEADAALR
jgi:hypothetical protein